MLMAVGIKPVASVEKVTKNILVTGPPGCGKSTLIKRLIAGKKVGGISTPEIRKDGQRRGFEIVNLKNGKKGILASVDVEEGPRVSKYRVNLKDLDELGSKALEEATSDPEIEIITVDEVGKMECFSERFKRAVVAALESEKKVLAAISYKNLSLCSRTLFLAHAQNKDFDPFIKEIKARADCRLFYLTRGNFEKVLAEIRKTLDLG